MSDHEMADSVNRAPDGDVRPGSRTVTRDAESATDPLDHAIRWFAMDSLVAAIDNAIDLAPVGCADLTDRLLAIKQDALKRREQA